MRTSRRNFLAALAGTVGALAVDPDRLLWTPGKKLISIPRQLRSGDIIRVDVVYRTMGYGYAPPFTPRVIVPEWVPIRIDLMPTSEELASKASMDAMPSGKLKP